MSCKLVTSVCRSVPHPSCLRMGCERVSYTGVSHWRSSRSFSRVSHRSAICPAEHCPTRGHNVAALLSRAATRKGPHYHYHKCHQLTERCPLCLSSTEGWTLQEELLVRVVSTSRLRWRAECTCTRTSRRQTATWSSSSKMLQTVHKSLLLPNN